MQKSKSAAEQEKTKLESKDGFDAYAMDQGDGQARPSHGGWPALPTATVTSGVKCTVPSQSPKKVEAKMACQMQVQQQAGQPMLTCIYLPLAPVGGPKPHRAKSGERAFGQGNESCSGTVHFHWNLAP